jgi:hypothetical protein
LTICVHYSITPLLITSFPDSGHIAELNRRGLGRFDANNYYVPGIPQDYIDYGKRWRWGTRHGPKVAFCGNLWLTAANRISYARTELLEIRRRALAACEANWDLSPFTSYCDAIDALSSDLRAQLRLNFDEPYSWIFRGQEITRVANGELRMRKLMACRQPIAYFGGFADPESRQIAAASGFVIEKDLPPDKELAAAFRHTRISLDVVTAPFINGFSHKLLACFASGGFMLTTRKLDIASSLGDVADTIGFSNGNELATKVEHYLNSDRDSRELANQIATLVRRNNSTRALFARTVPLALEHIRGR